MIDDQRPDEEAFHGFMNSLSMRFIEMSITEHPEFKTPRYDWGVMPASTSEEYWDEENVFHSSVFTPEDRTHYRPEWDGKSWADFWDWTNSRFKEDGPGELQGITRFCRAEPILTRY